MKICFLGSGSLGSTIGGALSEGGLDVCLVDQWEEHVNAMNERGLLISEGGAERAVRVRAATSPEGLGVMDLVIVLVKSFHTKSAVEGASSIIGPSTLVMSLQNGLGNEEAIAEVVGAERVLSGKTYVGGVIQGPGRVASGASGKLTVIGEMDGTMSERILAVADAFNAAGLTTEVSDNIVGMIWDKLLVNAGVAALTAVTRLPYGPMYEIPEVKKCAFSAIAECVAVAKAHGVRLATEDPETVWRKASDGLPYDFKPSMLLCLERRIRTEIDFINGAVVRLGERAGVPTPVNDTIVACIKGAERSMGIE